MDFVFSLLPPASENEPTSPTALVERIKASQPDDWKAVQELGKSVADNPDMVETVITKAGGEDACAKLLAEILDHPEATEKRRGITIWAIGSLAKNAPSFAVTLDKKHGISVRERLVAMLNRATDAQPPTAASNNELSVATVALCHLVENTPWFAAGLEAGHGSDVRQAFMKLLCHGKDDTDKSNAARAIACVVEKTPTFAVALEMSFGEDLQRGLLDIVCSGSDAGKVHALRALSNMAENSPTFAQSLHASPEGARARRGVVALLPAGGMVSSHAARAVASLSQYSSEFAEALNAEHGPVLRTSLLKLLRDGSLEFDKYNAAMAIGELTRSVPAFGAEITGVDGGECGVGKQGVGALLVLLLQQGDHQDRLAACRAIGALVQSVGGFGEALVRANPVIRGQLASFHNHSYGSLAQYSREASETLDKVIGSEDAHARVKM